MKQHVVIAGASGVIGRTLTAHLLERGHTVIALVRPGSENKVAAGARVVADDLLTAEVYRKVLTTETILVQLVGTTHPGPFNAEQFEKTDKAAGMAAALAASDKRIKHLIYLSVAEQLPVMKAYVKVRQEVERSIKTQGIPASIFRPFYVLGPGRWWPVFLLPLFWIFKSQAATRHYVERMEFVTLRQIVAAMTAAIETPLPGFNVCEVPAIKRF